MIQLSREGIRGKADTHLFETEGLLVLEGLELQNDSGKEPHDWRRIPPGIILSQGAPLYLANCRILLKGHAGYNSLTALAPPVLELRNCEFLSDIEPSTSYDGVCYRCPTHGRFVVHNCLRLGHHALSLHYHGNDPQDCEIDVRRNTFVTSQAAVRVDLTMVPKLPAATTLHAPKALRVEAWANIFDTKPSVLLFGQWTFFLEKALLEPAQAEAFLVGVLGWGDHRNLYAANSTSVLWMIDRVAQPPRGPKTLKDWATYWKQTDSDSLEGLVKYKGGNLFAKLKATPEKLTPDDFRLRADSAGYRAGKDGKDLGADIDLVGPGPAYERWKKTPEYQQWLKDTKQVKKAEAPTAEPKAFVLLGGKGVEERKFDTLAEAVIGASDGDTIEVRGNGPFVSPPTDLGKLALTIRAGDGFRPLIQMSPEGTRTDVPMLKTEGPLVLEGLEWQRLIKGGCRPGIVSSSGSALHVANCRFHMEFGAGNVCIYSVSPLCTVLNCQFLCPAGDAVWGSYPKSQVRIMENCVHIGKCALGTIYDGGHQQNASIRLARNTFVAQTATGMLVQAVPDVAKEGQAVKPIQMDVSETIFDASYAFTFLVVERNVLSKENTLQPGEAEGVLRRLFVWQDRENVYALTGPMIFWELWKLDREDKLPEAPKSLADWKRFWGAPAADCVEGRVRYQGGDLLAKLAKSPDQLTAEDFRLRPDSAGYRAGKDGKDLGADVDLVGPGPAYERWKKTPAYQQWLKDSGQVKK